METTKNTNTNKFSKFFPNDEVRLVIFSREAKYFYFWYLFLLVAIFFFLFPLWHAGHYGVLLWVTVFVIVLIFFANYLLRRNTIYIVTQQKIWHVFFVNDHNIRLRGAINIDDIEDVRYQDHDLTIKTKEAFYYLKNIRDIQGVYNFLQKKDLSKNEKSGII